MEAPVLIGSSGDMTVIGRGGGGLRWAVRTYSGSFAAAAAALPAAGFEATAIATATATAAAGHGDGLLWVGRVGVGRQDTP